MQRDFTKDTHAHSVVLVFLAFLYCIYVCSFIKVAIRDLLIFWKALLLSLLSTPNQSIKGDMKDKKTT